MAFKDANVFRVYHKQMTSKEPSLRQYGLTIGRQDRLPRAVTRWLSPTISFEDVLGVGILGNGPRASTIYDR